MENILEEEKKMTIEEATEFFSWFYGGEHHFPSKIKQFGSSGWVITHDRGDIATYDYNGLTRLVLMAHEKCYRVSIMPWNFKSMKICIWKRRRDGDFSRRHPDIDKAIESFKKEIY